MIDYALIPLTAVLASAAFGAVAIAWDSDRRPTRSMAAVFVCTACWAMVDLLTVLEAEASAALAWMRWVHVGPLMMGPAVMWTVAQMLPQVREPMVRRARAAAVVCGAVGVGLGFVPSSVLEMVPTDFGGWMPRYGWPSIVVMPLGVVLPTYAALVATRAKTRSPHDSRDRHRAWGVRVSVAFSVFVAMPTEYVMPLLEIPMPRLGAIGATLAAGSVWISVLHQIDDLVVTPQGVARSLLARLHDGVALVQLNGTILSTNLRFAEMAGRAGSTLLGTSLSSLVDAPLDRLRVGVENRESTLRIGGSESMPVSLSSSLARSRSGAPIGLVVVVRDLREVETLRGQLMNSGRLAAVGELAAGIAHEVNNPVAFIRSDLNLLSDRIDEIGRKAALGDRREEVESIVARARERVSAVFAAVEQVARVIVDVREFAHIGGRGQGGSDPEALVAGAVRLARLGARDDVELRLAGVRGSDRVEPGQEVKQALLSVLRVLSDRIESGGRIDIEASSEGDEFRVRLEASPCADVENGPDDGRDDAGGAAGQQHGRDVALSVAHELVARLSGTLSIEAAAGGAVHVLLVVPTRYPEAPW